MKSYPYIVFAFYGIYRYKVISRHSNFKRARKAATRFHNIALVFKTPKKHALIRKENVKEIWNYDKWVDNYAH